MSAPQTYLAALAAAIDNVTEVGYASTSRLQRKLRIGYGLAEQLLDDLQRLGIVGPRHGTAARDVLMDAKTAHKTLTTITQKAN